MLVNVFFGAFFGRVLVDTGIAATLIRKVVELGGDKPRITMALLCIVTAIIFMSMTGIGPVISIAVIVLPILLSLGIPAPCGHVQLHGFYHGRHLWKYRQFPAVPDHICGL
ncbi:MAG: hypothetical protein ACLTW9_20800 [Enterocloster sp.]